jgi:hypothetical protein
MTPRITLHDFYVYILFRWDGVPMYVGKGRRNRWVQHTCPCNLLGNDRKTNVLKKTIRLLGEVPRIKVAEGLVEDDAINIEAALILAIGRHPNGPLLNYTDGGQGPHNMTAEAREKIAQAHRGRKASPETRAKLSAAHKGRKPSQEAIEAIRAYFTGRPKSPEHRAKLSAVKKGLPTTISKSPEARAKIGAAQRGRTHTAEVREKIRLARRGQQPSDETRLKMSLAQSQRGPWSEAVKQKIRESKLGKLRSAETRAKISATRRARYGKSN